MDDVSKLGPLWVKQLTADVTKRRNRAAESLLTVNPDGDYAKHHHMLIDAANAMLAAPALLEALRKIERELDMRMTHQADNRGYPFWNELWDIASAALDAAGSTAA